MPLTKKGQKIARAMKRTYGRNWKRVFYASANSGRIKGVHGRKHPRTHRV